MVPQADLEKELRSRTVALVQQFDDEIDALTSKTAPSAQQLRSLDGIAGNTVRLLRENKTNTVRAEQADPGSFDADGVKAAIDSAIRHVFDTKAEWHSPKMSGPSEVDLDDDIRDDDIRDDDDDDLDEDIRDNDDHHEDGGADIVDELAALAKLRKAGVLSKKEFRTATARLARR